MIRFEDLKIGDKFEATGELAGEVMIKIGNNSKTHKPLNERPTNAINLNNGHRMVVGDRAPVILIKEVLI